MAVLKFLLVLFCIYWLAKQVIKAVLRKVLYSVQSTLVNQQEAYNNQQTYQTNNAPEGSMQYNENQAPAAQQKFDYSGGEYIEYEEVKQ